MDISVHQCLETDVMKGPQRLKRKGFPCLSNGNSTKTMTDKKKGTISCVLLLPSELFSVLLE